MLKLSFPNAYCTLYNIKAKEETSANAIIESIEKGWNTSGSYLNSRCTKKGCFESFRERTFSGVFSFTHSLYPEFVEKFVDEWNKKCKIVKIKIKYKKPYEIYKSTSFGETNYHFKGFSSKGEFVTTLYGYVFSIRVRDDFKKHNTILVYLAHHVIRLFSFGEYSTKNTFNMRELEDLDSFYEKHGFYGTLMKLNNNGRSPRRLTNTTLTKLNIMKMLSEKVWEKIKPRNSWGYTGQTSVMSIINNIKLPEYTIRFNRNSDLYVRGIYRSTIVGRTKKAKVLELIDGTHFILKIFKHALGEYVGRVITVRTDTVLPIELKDVTEIEYEMTNEVDNYEIISME